MQNPLVKLIGLYSVDENPDVTLVELIISGENGATLAERGMQENECKSVIGVYFKANNSGFDIYVRCTISQDFTGGWRDDRAEKIGKRICLKLGNCE